MHALSESLTVICATRLRQFAVLLSLLNLLRQIESLRRLLRRATENESGLPSYADAIVVFRAGALALIVIAAASTGMVWHQRSNGFRNKRQRGNAKQRGAKQRT